MFAGLKVQYTLQVLLFVLVLSSQVYQKGRGKYLETLAPKASRRQNGIVPV
jgi:hypothetical protein